MVVRKFNFALFSRICKILFHDADVGYINISLIVILNAKTQYHARQLQQLKSLYISRVI